MNSRDHCDAIYRTKTTSELSWYQPEAALSLDLIRRTTPAHDAPIFDVGGGASTLVDGLLGMGYRKVAVLDIAPASLTRARERLGARATRVEWVAADILTAPLRWAASMSGVREDHRTPTGSTQAFTYCLCRVGTPTDAV